MITYHGLGSNGRLGNQLWQIAGTMALGEIHQDEFVIDEDWSYRDAFSFPDECFGKPEGIHAPTLWETSPEWTSHYLGDLQFVNRVENQLRNYLRPSTQIRKELAAYNVTDRVSVHVRREDYLGSDLHLVLDADWYKPLPDNALFFGLDVAWIKANFPGVEVMQTNNEILDLFLMASCRAHVISNSTFAWWGAWIGEGPCIGPRWWYQAGHGLDDNSHNMPSRWTLKDNPR